MKKPAGIKKPNIESDFTTLAIMCYDEQLPEGEESLYEAIRSISPELFQIVGIKHYKSKGKLHYHILIRCSKKKKRQRIIPMLKQLGFDVKRSMDNPTEYINLPHTIETCGSYNNYVNYLLHRTTTAIQEGKEPYDKSDFITNLSDEDIQAILDGYFSPKGELTTKGYKCMLERARQIGREFGDLDNMINSFNVYGLTPKQESQIQASYLSGAKERLKSGNRIYRLSIEINTSDEDDETKQNIQNAIEYAMNDKRTVIIDGKPTATILPSTEALIIYNRPKKDHMEHRAICMPRAIEIPTKYSASKGIWAGSYVISTYSDTHKPNSNRRDIDNYSIKSTHDDGEIEIINTRNEFTFYCSVTNHELHCDITPSINIDSKKQFDFLVSEFKAFSVKFNEYFGIMPKQYKISLDDIQ